MRTLASLALGLLVAGVLAMHGGGTQSAAERDMTAAAASPQLQVELRQLPAGHPPLNGYTAAPSLPYWHPPIDVDHGAPSLPPGHPVVRLPEGHPPIDMPEGMGDCPAGVVPGAPSGDESIEAAPQAPSSVST